MHNQREPTRANADGGLQRLFGSRLREERQALGLTQEAVAAAAREHGARVDKTGIVRMEQGSRTVSLNDAAAIAAALRIDLAALLAPAQPSAADELARLDERLDELDAQLTSLGAERDVTSARAERIRQFLSQESDQ